jgi:DNA gyrase subunit A
MEADVSDDPNAVAGAEERLRVFEGFEVVLRDPHALLDVLLESRDQADATARLAERYGISADAAEHVLWLQLLRLTGEGRQRIADELAGVRAFLAEHS